MRKTKRNDQIISVAVVICTHNRPESLERCLGALRKVDYPAFAVTVVDSARKSCVAKKLAGRYSVDYCVSPEKGLSRARNVGTRVCGGDIIAYLDDDMVPHASWLQALTNEFTDPEVVAVTGPILPLEAWRLGETDLRVLLERVPWGSARFHIDRSAKQWFERANFGGIGDGNFALRRKAFELLPNFDEHLGRGMTINSGEEHYAYFRLVDLGGKIAYTPQGVVFHPSSPRNRDQRQRVIAEAVAYGAFLAFQHPSFFWRIAKYFAAGVIGSGRWWRKPSEQATDPLSSREKCSAALKGLSVFWRSRRQTELL
jgi:glycosyltransferase involved in cell wall biosynthesis